MPDTSHPPATHGNGVTSLSHKMKVDWNRRARTHARFWVATGHHENDTTFIESGRRDALMLLAALGPSHRSSWRALEIGCGVGRLMRMLAPHFAHLYGVDVSGEMIEQSRRFLAGVTNVEAVESNGTDLQAFPDDHVDLVYSYVAFQHMPEEVFVGYLCEAHRVLKTDGVLLFQIYLGTRRSLAQADTFTVRVYEPDKLERHLRAAGFRLESRQKLSTEGPGLDNWLLLARKAGAGACAQPPVTQPVNPHYLSQAELNMYAALIGGALQTSQPHTILPTVDTLLESLDDMLREDPHNESARRFREVLAKLEGTLRAAKPARPPDNGGAPIATDREPCAGSGRDTPPGPTVAAPL